MYRITLYGRTQGLTHVPTNADWPRLADAIAHATTQADVWHDLHWCRLTIDWVGEHPRGQTIEDSVRLDTATLAHLRRHCEVRPKLTLATSYYVVAVGKTVHDLGEDLSGPHATYKLANEVLNKLSINSRATIVRR